MADLDGIAARLDEIVADLDEIAFERLRVAAASGAVRRPDDDKELLKARRAVEKAAHVVRGLTETPDPD